jgi:hypothetical protein
MLGESYGVDGIIPDTVTAGQSFTYTFNYTIPDDFNTNRLYLVAVVHKHKGLKKYRRILNARQEKFSPLVTAVSPEQNKEVFRVWPNPAHDVVTIQTEGNNRIRTIQLLTLTGIKLAEYHFNQNKITLPVADLNNSCILLRAVTTENEVLNQLLIIR